MAQRKRALIVYGSERKQEIRAIKQELRKTYPEWRFYFEVKGVPEHDHAKFNAVIRETEYPFLEQIHRDLKGQDPEKKTATERKPRPKPRAMRNATGGATGDVTDG